MSLRTLSLIILLVSLSACQDDDDTKASNKDMSSAKMSDATEDINDQDMSERLSDASVDADLKPPLKALGEGCEDGSQCSSGHCPGSLFGNICGECLNDSHCTWGCDPPAVMGVGNVGPSLCNDGTQGSRCETKAACQEGLSCGKNPLTLPIGEDTLSTCNGCESDADCQPTQRCAIVTQPSATPKLAFSCIDLQSKPLGTICDWERGDDEACSQRCAVASISGVVDFKIGVCSECMDDADCPDGTRCTSPTVNIMMPQQPTPGRCDAL